MGFKAKMEILHDTVIRNLTILYLVCLAVTGDSLRNRWRRRGLVEVRAVVIEQQLIAQGVQFCKQFTL